GIAITAGVPDDRMPVVELLAAESVDSTYNDPALTERIAAALTKGMGAQNVIQIDPLMVSEDFGRFGIGRKIPISMINLGAVDPAAIGASAHDFWIEPSTFHPAIGDRVTAALRVGQKLAGDPLPNIPPLIDRFVLRGSSGERAVVGRAGADPAGIAFIAEGGL